MTASAFLIDNQAVAACVLWASGQFSTREIADLLHVRECSCYRTLHMAREGARADALRENRNEGSA